MNTMRDWAGSDDFGTFLLIIGGLVVGGLWALARASARYQEAREADQLQPAAMEAYGLVDAREFVSAGEPRTAPALTSSGVEEADTAGSAELRRSEPVRASASGSFDDVCRRAFGDDPTPRSGPTVTHLAGGLPSAGDTSPSQLPSSASG